MELCNNNNNCGDVWSLAFGQNQTEHKKFPVLMWNDESNNFFHVLHQSIDRSSNFPKIETKNHWEMFEMRYVVCVWIAEKGTDKKIDLPEVDWDNDGRFFLSSSLSGTNCLNRWPPPSREWAFVLQICNQQTKWWQAIRSAVACGVEERDPDPSSLMLFDDWVHICFRRWCKLSCAMERQTIVHEFIDMNDDDGFRIWRKNGNGNRRKKKTCIFLKKSHTKEQTGPSWDSMMADKRDSEKGKGSNHPRGKETRRCLLDHNDFSISRWCLKWV